MKNKKFEIETTGKKLNLDKVVISNLDMNKIKGGGVMATATCYLSCFCGTITCP